MSDLIAKAEAFVTELLNDELDNKFVYHNLPHTQRVVEKAKELSALAQLNETDHEILLLSTWFHDTGYTKTIENHEDTSAAIATKFLQKHKYSQPNIDAVCSLILATKMAYEPVTLLEKLIRDADCAHIGSKNYSEVSE